MAGFGIVDYIVCAGMVIASGVIGLVYSIWSRRGNSEDVAATYLMGGRKMPVFPIAMSLIISLFSGAALQGYTGEIYVYGASTVYKLPSSIITAFVGCYISLPVFHELKLTSVHEYLVKRFDGRVRTLCSFLWFFTTILSCATTVYFAAIGFRQVSGVNTHVTTACICIVTSLYTVNGGFKAVVWADTAQMAITLLGIAVLLIKGTVDVGGLNVVSKRALESGRLEFPSFQTDLEVRYTFWNTFIAGTVNTMIPYLINQSAVQRYVSLPTLRQARIATWIYIIGVKIVGLICVYMGLLIYATYYDCDPLATKQVRSADQLLMFLVQRVMGNYPGLPGLFAATVFSVCLSTYSTGLNTSALIVLEDFVKPHKSKPLSNKSTKIIMQVTVAVITVAVFGLIFVIEKVLLVLPFAVILHSITLGPVLAIYFGGLLLPWINAQGALYGGIIGCLVTAVLAVGSQVFTLKGQIRYPGKPTSVAGCQNLFNATVSSAMSAAKKPSSYSGYVFPLFKMSHLWFCLFGAVVTIVAIVIISFFTGFTDLKELNPKLLAPVVRKFLPEKKKGIELKPMVNNGEENPLITKSNGESHPM